MSGRPDPTRVTAWHEGALADAELAAALLCDVEIVRDLLDMPGFQSELGSDGNGTSRRLSPRLRAGLAISHALHSQAGLALSAAADVVAGSWRTIDSVLATLDFFPPPEDEAKDSTIRRSLPGEEADPFALFVAHAGEELPIPAVDEYLDVIDGRRVLWRKPKEDAYRLGCHLHRLSGCAATDSSSGRHEEFLAVLGRLREPADQIVEWIGSVDHESFRPRSDRFADQTPFLRQGIDFICNPARFDSAYRTRVSVNISLAARSMKRRALGLQVNSVTDRTRSRPVHLAGAV